MKTKPCMKCRAAIVSLPDELNRFALCRDCWLGMPSAKIIQEVRKYEQGATRLLVEVR